MVSVPRRQRPVARLLRHRDALECLLIGRRHGSAAATWQLREKLGSGRDGPGRPRFAGLLVLVWCFANVSEFDCPLYPRGYLVSPASAALVVLVAVHPATTITRGCSPPRRCLDREASYGIYCGIGPVVLVTRPGLDIPLTGIPLFVLRVGITVGAGSVVRFVRCRSQSARSAGDSRRCSTAAAVFDAATAARPDTIGFPRRRRRDHGDARHGLAVAHRAAAAGLSGKAGEHRDHDDHRCPRASTPTSAARPLRLPRTRAPTTTLTPIPNAQVTAIGDSVMLGAQSSPPSLLGDRLQMDANVSRHFSEGLDVVRRLHDAGQLGDEVVVHLGTNGSVPEDQLDEMMQLLSGVKRVVLVNTRVDRPWSNRTTTRSRLPCPAIQRRAARLVHSGEPAPEFLVDDGVHLSNAGRRITRSWWRASSDHSVASSV